MAQVINDPKTLAYSENVQGWPSHYSFIPAGSISHNNRFFSFSKGTIWEHNVTTDEDGNTVNRNEFYGDPINADLTVASNSRPSQIQFIFNNVASTVKNFKTLGYVGMGDWDANIATNTESRIINDTTLPVEYSNVGAIENFIEEEGNFYSEILGTNPTSIADLDPAADNFYSLGQPTDTTSTVIDDIGPGDFFATVTLTFSMVDSIITAGDNIYYYRNTGTATAPIYSQTLLWLGVVSSVDASTNTVVVDGSDRVSGGDFTTPTVIVSGSNHFFLASKNRVAEKSGVLGNVMIVTMTNTDNTEHAEIFSVNTSVFGSAP